MAGNFLAITYANHQIEQLEVRQQLFHSIPI
jgi:hypothetical protein